MPADYTIKRRIGFFEKLAEMFNIFSPVQTVFYFFAIGIVIRQGKFHRTDNRLNPLPFFLPIGHCLRSAFSKSFFSVAERQRQKRRNKVRKPYFHIVYLITSFSFLCKSSPVMFLATITPSGSSRTLAGIPRTP